MFLFTITSRSGKTKPALGPNHLSSRWSDQCVKIITSPTSCQG